MQYALITGASKGIGKAIAEELAAKKINLLLVARGEDLLREISAGLSAKCGIQADHLALDLSEPGSAEKLYSWVMQKGYQVNILVNNAGYGLSGLFESYTSKEYLDMMRVNMTVPLELSMLFIPHLKQQPQKSYIMNIVSSAAYQAVPGLSVYAASKAFVLNFTRGLRYELRKTNISVTAVSPGATDTAFSNRAKIGPKALKAAEKFNMTPKAVAEIAVAAMFAGKAETVTGFVNKLGAFLVWLLPKGLAEKTAAGLYDMD
jgi:short-subunit dehydrogenase